MQFTGEEHISGYKEHMKWQAYSCLALYFVMTGWISCTETFERSPS